MAEPPQKKKKQFQGDMCNITLEALMQVAKTKRWLGKECSTEMHPLKRCLFKLTRAFFHLQHKQHLLRLFDYGTLNILKIHGTVYLLFCFYVKHLLWSKFVQTLPVCQRIFLFTNRWGDSELSRCWRDSNPLGILGGNWET